MNLSNLRKLDVLRADITNKPYVFLFFIRCNDTELHVVNRRDQTGGWECHYAQHAEVTCEYCGSIELYSHCDKFTELFQRNYDEVLTFVRQNK